MFSKYYQPPLLGWWHAFLAVFVFQALSYNVMRAAAAHFHIDALLYSCCLFLGAAFSLLLIGRKGRVSHAALRRPHTWVYGICLLLMFAINTTLLAYITSTELVLIQRVTMLVGIMMGAFFLLRKPGYDRLVGGALVLVGVVTILADIEVEHRLLIYSVVGIMGIVGALRIFMAELHPENAEPMDFISRCKLAGVVTAFTGMLFFLVALLIAYLQTLAVTPLELLPVFSDFKNRGTIYIGLLQGAVLIAPLRYLEFNSARLIKAENFLAVVALAPIATLAWEMIFVGAGVFDVRRFHLLTLFAGLCITLGALFIVYVRIKKEMAGDFDLVHYMVRVSREAAKVEQEQAIAEENQRRRMEDQIAASQDSHEIVLETMQRYQGDVPKVAELLGLPERVVEHIAADKEEKLMLNPDVLRRVMRNYRRNVVTADPLTGLKNRLYFDNAVQRAVKEHSLFTVFFIDLNDFKLVNDQYGHEVGDKLLQSVGNRIYNFVALEDVAARLGGDEFGILLYGVDKPTAQEVASELKELLAAAHKFNDVKGELVATASIGFATYPEDGITAQELMKLADHNMYKVKGSK